MSSYTFAVGDVHGCYEQLCDLVRRIESSRKTGHIVFLGDYVDRGPDSKDVIDFLRIGPTKPDWRWTILKGNHEDMMVSCIKGENPIEWWVGNGGSDTLASFGGDVPADYIEWADKLPTLHVDDHRIFVHAGIDETVPLYEQSEQTMLWSRKPPHYSGHYWGLHVCHGHTPGFDNPKTIGNRTNVDSGAVFGGTLSCAVFDDSAPGCPVEFIETQRGKAA